MEALALFDFEATQTDELSFKRGDIIKVLDMRTDQNWYTAERHGEEGLVPKPYIELKDHDWWYGRTSRSEAERILKTEGGDGSFLVRDSEANPGDFSVSVKYGDAVQHYKVLRDGEGKYFLWVMKFPSLNTLIKYHKEQSISKTQHIFLKDFRRKSDQVPPGPVVQPSIRMNPSPKAPVKSTVPPGPVVQPSISMNPSPKAPVKSTPPPAQQEQFCEALYEFQPQNPDEIRLVVGAKIRIINRADANWWEGECNGRRGMFPATYVRELD
ncbi:growth factor receptor-bound protein 2-like isoform X3 [Bolinopsis microptera]|uniref:growth factor receptor-bound protein 2-like isoform X3 n=1 Tax=Bolinopsis microptera TaxID=2820187 RepID=UPI003079240E